MSKNQIAIAAPLPLQAGLQMLALPCMFLLFGFLTGSWAGRIPALRDALSLPHSQLSMVLLCGGLGAVISYPLIARLMRHLGARHSLLVSGLALVADIVAIGAARNLPQLMLAVLMLGVAASCFDVAVNALATERECKSGRAGLSVLHAWFCAGSLGGAAVASLMAAHGVAPAAHFAILALPATALLLLAHAVVCEGRAAAGDVSKSFALPKGPIAMLGAIGFLAAMAEGSIVDWSGVFMKDHFGVADAMTPWALSAFNTLMLVARLGGDRIKARYGARRPLVAGAVLAAFGLLSSVLAPDAISALPGFALAGCGLAFVFPFVFSAAGREGPTALAAIATMTYSGSLLGPPLMGGLAQGLGIQATIMLVGLLSVAIAITALKASALEQGAS
jgi:MFS family permease